MQRAIGYVRVSTDDQTASGLSLDHQEARIAAYAVANEFDLVEIILDPGVSAGKPLAAGREGRGCSPVVSHCHRLTWSWREPAAARTAGYV